MSMANKKYLIDLDKFRPPKLKRLGEKYALTKFKVSKCSTANAHDINKEIFNHCTFVQAVNSVYFNFVLL